MASLPLSAQVFAITAALIEERTGLHYGPDDRLLLQDRLTVRASERGLESLLDYYYLLRYDPEGPAEFERLIETLVVGETYFFREFTQLEAVVQEVIAPLVGSGLRPRVWSAACATGEEPLTLAMLLHDRGLWGKVELVATDLSQRSLEQAQRGSYGRRSVRAVPSPRLAERYLTAQDGRFVVAPELREGIEWRRVNLTDEQQVRALGAMDVILCRNVLIYFRDEVARAVSDRLAGALAPGGVLVVSVSESLLRFGTQLVCEERGGAFMYKKELGR
jgi:chemotaxis protein methyltransferase CheR